MIVYVWARCSASSLEPMGGLKNVLWVNVTTTTSTEAARRKINVPTMIIVILRWRLACSKLRSSSTIFCASFTTIFRGRTESFLWVELALRTFVLLLELPLLPFPGHFFSLLNSHYIQLSFGSYYNTSDTNFIVIYIIVIFFHYSCS